MGGSEWCCQLQRVVVIGCDSLQQCDNIVCCVAVDEREDVHNDGEECELCGGLFSLWEVSQGHPWFHIENHYVQSKEVATIDIDSHDAIEGFSSVAEGVRKLRYSFRTISATKNCRYMPREIISDEVGRLPRYEHNRDSDDYQIDILDLGRFRISSANYYWNEQSDKECETDNKPHCDGCTRPTGVFSTSNNAQRNQGLFAFGCCRL